MKTAVITGGNSGMGKAAALGLAKKGYRVILHGRDEAKAIASVNEIKTISGNTAIDYIVCDISLVKGMHELANAIKQKTDVIHALVLSTGVILPKQIITTDGIEKGFAIQYLSRFAITHLLMPELKKGNAKIVHVAAPKIKNAAIYFDDLALKNNFTMVRAMGQEMFANHLFVQEFAKRNPGNEVVMNMMNVGVASTGITREMNFILRFLVKLFGKSTKTASKNTIYLASDAGVNFSGYFLPKPGKPDVREKIAYDAAIAERLWNKSMEMIKN